jgi:beta-glucanase (GH16 family)
LEREYYTPQNVSVHDGYLDLVAQKQYVDPKHDYTSGMVSTNDCCGQPVTFEFQYGYMETSAQLPPGKGMWPAFWLVPANHTWPPEIDAMEWQGQKPRTNFLTIHWGKAKDPQQSGGTFVGPNMSHGFHTYGLDWEATYVTWYEDGKAVRTYSDPAHIPHLPMIVILNLAIGGWLGFPDKHTVFPAHMLVDYVRVWNAYPY